MFSIETTAEVCVISGRTELVFQLGESADIVLKLCQLALNMYIGLPKSPLLLGLLIGDGLRILLFLFLDRGEIVGHQLLVLCFLIVIKINIDIN